ncbi:MAG: hypothetical protein BMS9Abin12_2206 [Acidimicrobiia bacterium]|nr:MAG: hypothetical protein BMS9Abin12_2206 [Acidimicrobiia bacterium]
MHAVTASPIDPNRRVTVFGWLTILPLLVWWAGWFPAIMSSDSIDQWGQVLAFDFQNVHPITDTAFLWVVSLVWESPGAVALVQVFLFALLLGIVARRLVQIGIPQWLSIGVVWVIALLPMTGATTIAIWKDIPFTIAMGWVFTELLLLANGRTRFWATWYGPARLGIGLGLMWALRVNGKLTVVVFILALAVGFRTQWKNILVLGASTLGIGVALPGILIAVLPVTNRPIEPAQVFMPDVGSVVVNDLQALSAEDLELIQAVAPLRVWEEKYACGDSSPLLFDPEYDNSVIQENASAYRALIIRSAFAAPGTVAGHRWCAGEYLLSPYNRTGTFVHRPPFAIPQNDLGLERSPLSDRAYAITLWAYKIVEYPKIEWLTWRPAIYVLAGLVTFAAVWRRRRLRPLAWIGLLFVLQLGNVFITSPSHEFRYAFGLYLITLASIPLWYLIVEPSRAKIEPS